MGTDPTDRALTFGEISQLGYLLVTDILQPRLKDDGVKEGSAVWTPCPFNTAAAMRADGKLVGLAGRYTIDADDAPAAVTLMLAKSMVYALYAGCLDLLKRERHWRQRVYEPGSEVAASATIGGITLTLTLSVVTLSVVTP